jgi:hypothetical protein
MADNPNFPGLNYWRELPGSRNAAQFDQVAGTQNWNLASVPDEYAGGLVLQEARALVEKEGHNATQAHRESLPGLFDGQLAYGRGVTKHPTGDHGQFARALRQQRSAAGRSDEAQAQREAAPLLHERTPQAALATDGRGCTAPRAVKSEALASQLAEHGR